MNQNTANRPPVYSDKNATASFGSAVADRSGGWKRSVRIGGGRWLLQTELFGGVSQGGRVETEQTPPEVHLFTRLPAAFAPNGAAKRRTK
ncbi:hypothetical protein KSP40_PGU005516 [Platanthera guangdongensis]|uniref:Uncharacterized protein n=1 Tax=Platanthera guangdongensis TaxID=2320717 RepID=A0ABR2LWL9_9ASPA